MQQLWCIFRLIIWDNIGHSLDIQQFSIIAMNLQMLLLIHINVM